MPNFAYRAKTAGGDNADGTIIAGDAREAMALLRRQALFPIEVIDRSARTGAFEWKLDLPKRVKAETIADTLTQLSDLLNGGVTLLESLTILAEQSADETMADVLADVRDRVADGENLDEALAAHPKVFSELVVSMVRAGLEGAFLEESLQHVAGFLQKQDAIRGKVSGAMTYPIVLMVVGGIVTVVLVMYVVPMFEPFFERLQRSGAGLPLATVVLLALSHSLVRFGVLVLIAAAGVVVMLRRAVGTPKGRRVLDRLKLKIPIAGSIFHSMAVSRFCRVLGTLLRNGVPLLKSLDISSTSTGNVLLAETIQKASENISSGNSLAAPLAASGLIPPQVMAMMRVAEESNSLDSVLVKIADRMDEKTERKLDAMVRLIEPLMLLIIGAMVMFIIVAVLLPVFDMNTALD
ncbi:type II secretion system F family protein [Crateriforma conspicua]|uniref:General secretion pathway protein F n=1 Tax=Crateriforma conspicua TaxID=2527996 RepID=A0A5C5Y509_9PLAN|nr:type II secretion system F family protein [Crateriforma conspicua]QDV64981.1 Type II secretion system protein F [Crateriforma conspicua]TWT70380.1 Type II secretion system protein F [Crateriforma conspicua]